MKSAESDRKKYIFHETCPEADGVTDMPGVRRSWSELCESTDVLPNERVYTLTVSKGAGTSRAWYSWISKTGCYENPCTVTGGTVYACICGIQAQRQEPKSVTKGFSFRIGLSERSKLRTLRRLQAYDVVYGKADGINPFV